MAKAPLLSSVDAEAAENEAVNGGDDSMRRFLGVHLPGQDTVSGKHRVPGTPEYALANALANVCAENEVVKTAPIFSLFPSAVEVDLPTPQQRYFGDKGGAATHEDPAGHDG